MKKSIIIIALATMTIAACANSDVSGLQDPAQLTAGSVTTLGELAQNDATKVGNPLESLPDDSNGYTTDEGNALTEHARVGVKKIETEGKLKEHDLWQGSLNGSDILVKFDIPAGYVYVVTAKDAPPAQIQFFVNLAGVGSAEGVVQITVEPDGDGLDVRADGQKLSIVADEDYDALNDSFSKTEDKADQGTVKVEKMSKPTKIDDARVDATKIYDIFFGNVKKIKSKDIRDPSEDD